jgi:hypothetical protein
MISPPFSSKVFDGSPNRDSGLTTGRGQSEKKYQATAGLPPRSSRFKNAPTNSTNSLSYRARNNNSGNHN